MIRITANSTMRYGFDRWAQAPLVQGVFTRLGGVSAAPYASLNVGRTVGDDPACVEANHRTVYDALGIPPEMVVTAQQVHGAQVRVVSAADGEKVLPATDALITNTPGLSLLLRVADCVPVFFYAPHQRAIGLAHAGWQGTLRGITVLTAQAMMSAFGCSPDDLQVGLGPAIGPCCFEVGPEIVAQVRAQFADPEPLLSNHQTNGKAHLNLWQANIQTLHALRIQQIEMTGLCTACHLDEFYSHRAERGRTGRLAAVIGLRP